MLLSLDPDRMAQLGLTVSDVAAAVQEQNATNPAGRSGREPAPPGTQLTIPVITSGRLKEASDFERIIVRGRPDGSLVHLSDIGEARLGARNYDLAGRFDGAPTALTPVFLRPGANALQVKQEVVTRMTELAKNFPPGVRWSIAFDTTPYVTASINEVVKTLFEALLLVTLVVFVFLQSWRATLIPVVAVPVSITGAFFGMQVLGFSVNRFFGRFNRGFRAVTERYLGAAGRVIDRPRTFFAAFAVAVALLLVLVRSVPTGFIPSEDKGYFGMLVELPDNASRQRTEAVVKQVEGFLLQQPAIHHVVSLVGLNFIQNANQTNAAIMFVMLKPWDERTAPREQFPAVLGAVNGYLFQLQQTRGFAFNLPEIIGLGTTAGLELNLQDRGVNDVTRFAGLAGEFAADANALPQLRGVYPTIRVNTPQLFVQVDREKVKALGISLSELFQTLQASLSTLYINDFNRYGKTYRVQAEAQSRFRQTPEDIGRLYVRGPNQQMVPVSALTRTEFRAGPSVITRFNGFTSALLVGAPGPGKSSGDMLAAVERLAQDKYTGRGVGYAFSGQSYQERASGGQGGLVFALGLVMVFLVLAAQYESWSIPFAVLLGVPFGTLGALLGVWLRGMANDVYVQIGLIVVVGLAAKNAILIVEFANELRAQGRSIKGAALEAGRERLRPILMTSFAFILGVTPLLTSSGAGAASRHSIGTGVFFGMLVATTVGIFFIPLFFTVIRALSERGLARPLRESAAARQVAPAPATGD